MSPVYQCRTIRDISQQVHCLAAAQSFPLLRLATLIPLRNNLLLHIIFNLSCYFLNLKLVNFISPVHILQFSLFGVVSRSLKWLFKVATKPKQTCFKGSTYLCFSDSDSVGSLDNLNLSQSRVKKEKCFFSSMENLQQQPLKCKNPTKARLLLPNKKLDLDQTKIHSVLGKMGKQDVRIEIWLLSFTAVSTVKAIQPLQGLEGGGQSREYIRGCDVSRKNSSRGRSENNEATSSGWTLRFSNAQIQSDTGDQHYDHQRQRQHGVAVSHGASITSIQPSAAQTSHSHTRDAVVKTRAAAVVASQKKKNPTKKQLI